MRRLRNLVAVALFLLAGVTTAGAQQATRDMTHKPRPTFADGQRGAYANSWALIIGINTYQKGAPPLNYAVADAKAVAELLTGLGFPSQNIRLLLDSDATRQRIEDVLYREFAQIGKDDRLLVYFAGHGDTIPVRGGEEGYFLPYDADRNALPATAILMEDMKRIGKRLQAKHVLFVMDACFSGFSIARDIPPPMTDAYLESSLREPVVQVLTAGRKGEKAIEEGGHGLFTRRFLEGIGGLLPDTEGRGVITVNQLNTWLEPRVTRDSEGRMRPQYSKLEGDGEFVFFKGAGAPLPSDRPRPGLTGRQLTPEQRKAVDDTMTLAELFENRGDRARAIREYRRALELDPAHAEAKQGLTRLEDGGKSGR